MMIEKWGSFNLVFVIVTLFLVYSLDHIQSKDEGTLESRPKDIATRWALLCCPLHHREHLPDI